MHLSTFGDYECLMLFRSDSILFAKVRLGRNPISKSCQAQTQAQAEAFAKLHVVHSIMPVIHRHYGPFQVQIAFLQLNGQSKHKTRKVNGNAIIQYPHGNSWLFLSHCFSSICCCRLVRLFRITCHDIVSNATLGTVAENLLNLVKSVWSQVHKTLCSFARTSANDVE